MNKNIIFLIFLIILLFLTGIKEKFVNPCIDYLSDTEFLEHMIPHHQVAIDMSVLLQPKSKSPIKKNYLGKLFGSKITK